MRCCVCVYDCTFTWSPITSRLDIPSHSNVQTNKLVEILRTRTCFMSRPLSHSPLFLCLRQSIASMSICFHWRGGVEWCVVYLLLNYWYLCTLQMATNYHRHIYWNRVAFHHRLNSGAPVRLLCVCLRMFAKGQPTMCHSIERIWKIYLSDNKHFETEKHFRYFSILPLIGAHESTDHFPLLLLPHAHTSNRVWVCVFQLWMGNGQSVLSAVCSTIV